jgi:hypothetical protein
MDKREKEGRGGGGARGREIGRRKVDELILLAGICS